MASITADTLRALDACPDQVDLFARVYPRGVARITAPTVLRALREGLDVEWLLERQRAPLWAEYERLTAPFRAEYSAQIATFWAEYERQTAPIWAECERQTAPLLAEYLRRAIWGTP